MKKKIAALTCIMMITAAIGVFAAVQIKQDSLENMSKFDRMVKVMNETIEDDVIFNSTLVNYKYLEMVYKLNNTDMEYLANLIINGYSAEEVIECTYFWLDTNEDISIVKEMCDWRTMHEGYKNKDMWVESAFNGITFDKCGVLTVEDVEEYMKNGVTSEEIMTANRLSRMGVYTIQEILAKHGDGTSFADIAIEIENSVLPLSDKASMVKMRSALKSTHECPKAADDEIFASRQLAILQNEPENAYYDTTDETTDIKTVLEDKFEKVNDEIIEGLKNNGYLRQRKEDKVNENK